MNIEDSANADISELDDKLYIDWETGERIVAATLKHAYRMCVEMNTQSDTHPEDLAYNLRLIPALKIVLEYFGEKV